MKHIHKCKNCNKYTMKEACDCGSKALVAKPLKYSPDDRLSHYRRKAKLEDYKSRGIL